MKAGRANWIEYKSPLQPPQRISANGAKKTFGLGQAPWLVAEPKAMPRRRRKEEG